MDRGPRVHGLSASRLPSLRLIFASLNQSQALPSQQPQLVTAVVSRPPSLPLLTRATPAGGLIGGGEAVDDNGAGGAGGFRLFVGNLAWVTQSEVTGTLPPRAWGVGLGPSGRLRPGGDVFAVKERPTDLAPVS
jgi:hypothetical protein